MTTTFSTTTALSIGQILKSLPKRIFKPKSPPNSNPSATDCSSCTGLDHCAYPDSPGLHPATINGKLCLQSCRHLLAWQAAKHLENLQHNANIPLHYRNLSFKDYDCPPANQAAFLELIDATENQTSIYLSGPHLSGKTLLLSLMANRLIRQDIATLYTTAAELTLSLRYTSEVCQARLNDLQDTPVLIIDDLGAERKSDYSEEQLYLVIDGRTRRGNTTFLASNSRLRALADRYNDFLYHKILQHIKREIHLSAS